MIGLPVINGTPCRRTKIRFLKEFTGMVACKNPGDCSFGLVHDAHPGLVEFHEGCDFWITLKVGEDVELVAKTKGVK